MVAGYNVQIAVDDRHKLIVASEVVNDGNDSGQLHEMAVAAKKALGVETLQAVSDGGYYNGDTLRACEADDIVAYVPEANKNNRLAKQGRFTLKDFAYDAQADVYRCPAGAELRPMEGLQTGCRRQVACSLCRPAVGLRRLSTALAVPDRQGAAARSPSLAASGCDRSASRADGGGGRSCHDAAPGCPGRASLRHSQMPSRISTLPAARLLPVRGEWSLMALCYNFGRVLSILGLDRFLAYLAKNCPNRVNLLRAALSPACRMAAHQRYVAPAPPRPWHRVCPAPPSSNAA